MDAARAQLVCATVQACARRGGPLRRAAARLQYDLLAVLCSLRPAAMLDYAPVSLGVMRELMAAVATAVQVPCVLMTLAGCHLFGRQDTLARYLGQLTGAQDDATATGAAIHTQLVEFHGPGASAVPALMTQEAAGAVLAQLRPLREALSTDRSSASGTGAGGATDQRPATPERTGLVTFVDLERLSGLPLQPTLQGLLLGYPVVYRITSQEGAAAASQCLSTQGLVLHRVEATCASVLAGSRDGGAAGGGGRGRGGARTQMPEHDMQTLCSLSVPQALADGVRAGVDAWLARVAEAAVGSGGVWADVRLSVEQRSGAAVVL